MIAIEQWRSRIGTFRGSGDEDEDINERYWRWMDKKPPQYSERYIQDSEAFVKEYVIEGQNEPVLRLRGGGDPEPGSVWQLVRI